MVAPLNPPAQSPRSSGPAGPGNMQWPSTVRGRPPAFGRAGCSLGRVYLTRDFLRTRSRPAQIALALVPRLSPRTRERAGALSVKMRSPTRGPSSSTINGAVVSVCHILFVYLLLTPFRSAERRQDQGTIVLGPQERRRDRTRRNLLFRRWRRRWKCYALEKDIADINLEVTD